MRARYPDVEGRVVRDGVTLGYQVYGEPSTDGRPTIVLLPTWTIIHSRFWKMQVPYLTRHFHVVVYDGPGNGRSDRVTDPARYTPQSYAADAAEVLDACDVERVVAVGLSRGAWYALELAALRPDATAGLVLIGAALPLAPALPKREAIIDHFFDPAPEDPQEWDRYNLALLTDVATQADQDLGGLGPLTAQELAALIGDAFLGAEAMLLLGVTENEMPHRSALRRVGQWIRELEES